MIVIADTPNMFDANYMVSAYLIGVFTGTIMTLLLIFWIASKL